VNQGLYGQFTPLMVAAEIGDMGTVNILLNKAADPSLTFDSKKAEEFAEKANIKINKGFLEEMNGKSASEIAKMKGHDGVADKIQEASISKKFNIQKNDTSIATAKPGFHVKALTQSKNHDLPNK
jgi:ankyrin repeat protein